MKNMSRLLYDDTNEAWFDSLTTKEKARVLTNLTAKNVPIFEKVVIQAFWEKWLTTRHTNADTKELKDFTK